MKNARFEVLSCVDDSSLSEYDSILNGKYLPMLVTEQLAAYILSTVLEDTTSYPKRLESSAN